ncbi:type VI secretion system baseplate subunit TssG [Aquincola sp. S2]|uniref:Type VI secretion system baseplate subunit TssG n=1 Tax=Pseudaquabacterium terrae TaxID=2732868 RepID=A0ABX2EDM0_9BURK|nr:type VI secretion system baseplate subunit TssG [Aquabacterium terrae]NRF66460.1 type VI secretion system baseplate subunit TssG [Aquabacterium terrae]
MTSPALQELFAAVEAQPWAFDFYALMRRIDALRPQHPPLGLGQRPSQEAVRLGQVPELDFAPAAIAKFDNRHDHGAPRIGVRFFGLLGPHGPMPLHLTEFVRERLHQRADPTAARFLDVFHHRMTSLFYRAWAQAQPVVQQDRPQTDRYGSWLGATFGLNRLGAGRDAVPDNAKLYQAGLIASRSRHPEALTKVLRQYFGVPVALEPHVGQWLMLAGEDRSRLGFARNRTERSQVPHAELGLSANAGNKVWDRQYKFRLRLGPLTLAQYNDFLPGGRALHPLGDWVRLLAGLDLGWDAQLVLRRDEVPKPHLDRRMRLGLTSWLGRRGRQGPSTDRDELKLRPSSSFLMRRLGARA